MPPAQAGETVDRATVRQGLRPLEWLNFFLADVQTGLGPFLAAWLAIAGWNPERVGIAITVGGMVTVALQTPAGAAVDRSHCKRGVIAAGVGVLVVGAFLLLASTRTVWVYAAQVLIGGAGPFLAPTVAAITLGMVGAKAFGRQFGRNQSFNSAGNVFAALLVAGVSRWMGTREIFLVPIVLALPTCMTLAAIPAGRIDYAQSRGAKREGGHGRSGEDDVRLSAASAVLADRVLLTFFACACLFHLANAAMLPQLGEMLARHRTRSAAAFMSACIIVTQVVITLTAPRVAKWAERFGRRPLLLLGFGVLPIRGVLYTLVGGTLPLIAVQFLDGIANSIFGVVSIMVVADRTRGTGRFNLIQGALATMVGVGAALSTTLGGTLIQHFSYRISFLGLAGVALLAVIVLWFGVPETGQRVPPGTAMAAEQPAA
ncbi:MAG: MFS transporter [Acidobacteriaceae bacterium]